MKIFIELPTWLGDTIMSTPAIENLLKHYKKAHITIYGSLVSTQLFCNDSRISKIIVDESKNSKNRYIRLFKFAKNIKKVDLAISFRSSFSSKFMMFFIDANKKYNYKRYTKKQRHQVLRYNDFINKFLHTNYKADDLMLRFSPQWNKKPTLGLNPGASYGSAKRWYPEEFANIAIKLSSKYDIIIFGSKSELSIAKDIENILIEKGITNYQNLAGKTTISKLIEKIASLDLFITNDSGPMHIAAVYKVKTFTIFGPTKYMETSQWRNPFKHIITKNLECAPCMKRTCPLNHHDCMKLIKAEDILKEI